jgi:hypothetical protein
MKKMFLPAQEGETFSSGCLETVGVGGHLQALLQAVQGLRMSSTFKFKNNQNLANLPVVT